MGLRLQMFSLLGIAVFLAALPLSGCKTEADGNKEVSTTSSDFQAPFDSGKWGIKVGADYPHRELMLSTLVYTDTLRKLNREEILSLLGRPDRSSEAHLYYLINQTRLGPWPLKSRFMVIKLTPSDTVEWIKIHE
ncbi:hypothetical protein [Robiginitalea aurantiaca]|uniref:Outer membrane protein assembly factor BamE n=1 Tax=Robiginitalea aurantiaca TaxID=3056915 RepID=A0ABT7WCN1_9FLAO|nr:hypothetical protein [Robiginitalea aurantiaca]MDM9630675.1 hypothetical protein [Robiginitalea aurantiaca]